MTMNTLKHAIAPLAALMGLTLGAPALAHDYPTVDRVVFVQQCMVQHPGAHYEMLSKCSCALDKIAADVSFDDFETMVTASNATTIGGERAAEIRDNEGLQKEIRRYRDLVSKAKKSCFIMSEPVNR